MQILLLIYVVVILLHSTWALIGSICLLMDDLTPYTNIIHWHLVSNHRGSRTYGSIWELRRVCEFKDNNGRASVRKWNMFLSARFFEDTKVCQQGTRNIRLKQLWIILRKRSTGGKVYSLHRKMRGQCEGRWNLKRRMKDGWSLFGLLSAQPTDQSDRSDRLIDRRWTQHLELI